MLYYANIPFRRLVFPEAGVAHIFGSSGCNAASPPIEEVGPAPVFEAAFDGEQGVGARLRPARHPDGGTPRPVPCLP